MLYSIFNVNLYVLTLLVNCTCNSCMLQSTRLASAAQSFIIIRLYFYQKKIALDMLSSHQITLRARITLFYLEFAIYYFISDWT
jgi:hypothetical protein